MFSDIVQRFESSLNPLYRERDARRAQGRKVIDLISGNVNRAGFIFPPAVLKQALAEGVRRSRIYSPDPLGQPAARDAVRRHYLGQGLAVPSGQIVITPGTSVSYWYLFKLLANPGDEIICPRPSYPLLDSIADLSGVRLVPYHLLERKRWEIDLAHLQSQITSKTRAIVLISPHNPTGAVATDTEISGLAHIAARRKLPVISDEVFSTFLFNNTLFPRPASKHLPLVFTLDGVSKMLALPGLKIGWIAVTGDPYRVKKAIYALDMISDTFLPVNEAAQFALPVIFNKGQPFLARYRREMKKRMEGAVQALRLTGLSCVQPEGGFYLTVRLREEVDEEKFALDLLRKEGLLVHPGYFYDLEGTHLVISFVVPLKELKTSLLKIS